MLTQPDLLAWVEIQTALEQAQENLRLWAWYRARVKELLREMEGGGSPEHG